jgi:hypothetical protein
MVSIIESIVNNLNGLSTSTNGFRISTKSVFIHGNKSHVEFEYYGQPVKRELGDLIFILSVVYNGRKYFEKFTISQFKKDDGKLRWDLSNREQIYLLSRFPSFRGVKGSIIPMREFNLPNYSGCLGSFNLLFKPGDLVFISASRLESLIGDRKSINMIDVSESWEPPSYYFTYPIPFDLPEMKKLLYELFYVWLKIWNHKLPVPFLLPYFVGILGFAHSAYNVHVFVDKYLRGFIGELVYSDIGIYNVPALNFLCELLSAIMKKAEKERRSDIMSFINEFFSSYGSNQGGMREGVEFDYEGGGIGIIWTSINLGEGKEG